MTAANIDDKDRELLDAVQRLEEIAKAELGTPATPGEARQLEERIRELAAEESRRNNP